MQDLLIWGGVILLAVGVACLVLAGRGGRSQSEQRRLRGVAVVVDVAAAVMIAIGAFA